MRDTKRRRDLDVQILSILSITRCNALLPIHASATAHDLPPHLLCVRRNCLFSSQFILLDNIGERW
jgi:hypothetical protein